MPSRRTTSMAALVLATGLALAACGDDDGEAGLTGAAGDAAGADEPAVELPDDLVVYDETEVRVQSLDNTFRAPNIQVVPGATVTWTNDGRNEHDVLPTEGDAWGVEVEAFQPGDSYGYTFQEAGVYDYFCSIHGTETAGMIGTVVVADD